MLNGVENYYVIARNVFVPEIPPSYGSFALKAELLILNLDHKTKTGLSSMPSTL